MLLEDDFTSYDFSNEVFSNQNINETIICSNNFAV